VSANTTNDKMIDDYLDQVEAALSTLSASQRRQVVASISTHIDEARTDLPEDNEAAIQEILLRLGDPKDIAASAAYDLTESANDEPAKRTRRLSRRSLKLVIVVTFAAILVIASLSVAGVFGTTPVRQIQIPYIAPGTTAAAASADLAQNGLQPWIVCEPVWIPNPGAGLVAIVAPSAGRVPTGTFINIGVAGVPSGCHLHPHYVDPSVLRSLGPRLGPGMFLAELKFNYKPEVTYVRNFMAIVYPDTRPSLTIRFVQNPTYPAAINGLVTAIMGNLTSTRPSPVVLIVEEGGKR